MAVLDGHLIRYMGIVDASRWHSWRPGGLRVYERFEEAYLNYSKDMGISPSVLDVTIWFVMREARKMSIV